MRPAFIIVGTILLIAGLWGAVTGVTTATRAIQQYTICAQAVRDNPARDPADFLPCANLLTTQLWFRTFAAIAAFVLGAGFGLTAFGILAEKHPPDSSLSGAWVVLLAIGLIIGFMGFAWAAEDDCTRDPAYRYGLLCSRSLAPANVSILANLVALVGGAISTCSPLPGRMRLPWRSPPGNEGVSGMSNSSSDEGHR